MQGWCKGRWAGEETGEVGVAPAGDGLAVPVIWVAGALEGAVSA